LAEGGPVLVRLIAQIASRFGVVVTQKLAAQAVPVIGALGGAAVLRIHRPLSGDCASPFHGAQARTALSKDPVRMTYDKLSAATPAAA